MLKRLDIAIVGAGVSGLAVAISLARVGHRVTVYESFERARPIGSGLMLQPTGLAALARLGLRTRIEDLGHRIERLHGVTHRGAPIFDVSYTDLAPDLYAVGVHRAALHQTLWDAFVMTGARLETTARITALEPKADGRVAPADEHGRVFPAADLAIDASGARSVLRAIVTGKQARPFAYGAVWANVPDRDLSPGTLAQRYVAARVMVGHLPVGRMSAKEQPLAAIFWSLKPAEHAAWRMRFAPWRDEVAGLWPELAPLVAQWSGPDDLVLASYQHFTAPKPYRRNVVLIGDAAHATSPQLGQGANNGMIDAVVLAGMLECSPTLDAALAGYTRQRARHMRFYQMASALMTPMFQSDSTMLPLVRDLTFKRLRLVPYIRREMVRTLAGLKTGVFRHASPEEIVGARLGARAAETLLEPATGI